MADVQEVLIDFKVDYSELTKAQEQLAKSGKIDSADLAKFGKAISSTATDTKGLITEFKKVATTATQMGKSVEAAFGAGIKDALDEAGVSVDEFSEALKKANAPAKSVKAELLELKNALALAKANGKDTGEEFEKLKNRAGQLADAVADAGAEIKNAGSDTRNIDNVVGSISALAGGFAAVQGAAALFGDEQEDLQKALLKVNGAMALASGIQQFYQATLKEGAITKLADSVATGAQTAAQTIYTLAVGSSTGAMKAFRIALLATGIGAIVALLVMAADAMGVFGSNTEEATNATDDLTESLKNLDDNLEKSLTALDRRGKIQLDLLKRRGATEEEINKKSIELLNDRSRVVENNAKAEVAAINNTLESVGLFGKGLVRNAEEAKKLAANLRTLSGALPDGNAQKKAIDASLEAIDKVTQKFKEAENLTAEAVISGEEFKTAAIIEANKKRDEAREKADKKAKERRAQELQDNLAFLEIDLLAIKKNSAEELDLKKKIVRAKRDIELNGEKVTAAEVALIRAKAVDEQLKLQKEFNDKATAEQLQGQIDTNAALLAGIAINNEERLRLQMENLETQATLEINAAEGNATKILLIEAKKLSDIRALKNAAIDQERADEIRRSSSGRIKDALSKIAADQKTALDIRLAAIRGIEREELTANQNLIDDNNRRLKEGLISQQSYNDKYSELAQQRADIEEQTSAKIRETVDQDKEKRIENLKAIAQTTVEVLSQVADFFAALGQLATEQDRQRIDAQKKQLQALVEAGAISDKQAKIRANEIEIAERKARQRQAQREKQAAVFNALLAIPTAFLNGLSQGGIYLAAIYAALAAAQAAIVISRPVPKFFRGKKDNYEGRGIVGDMGSELVERNGRMFLYTKPTETYLNAKDKVYTAAETRTILHNTNISTAPAKEKQEKFDYHLFAKSIPKSSVNINIEKDFISEAVANGLSKSNYFNNRYQFKK